MSEHIMEVDDQGFNQVLQSAKPVLVDFWAPWCGPCKALGPVIDALAGEYGDRLVFAKCNIDNNPATPQKYGIRAIPTIMVFKDGQPVETITGMTSRGRLEESVKAVLTGAPPKQPFIVQ